MESNKTMELIHAKAKIQNGQLILDNDQPLPTDQDVEVVIIVPNKDRSLNDDEIRNKMQKDFKQAGIETDEQILELIRDVKKELLEERFKCKESF
jgi:hypothetical protein